MYSSLSLICEDDIILLSFIGYPFAPDALGPTSGISPVSNNK